MYHLAKEQEGSVIATYSSLKDSSHKENYLRQSIGIKL